LKHLLKKEYHHHHQNTIKNINKNIIKKSTNKNTRGAKDMSPET
jgi:hypothetical protein